MAEEEFGALGKTVTEFAGLETIKLRGSLTSIVYESDEVTAKCPVTGQPDWYTVRIEIRPQYTGIESKTLKLYLQSFREAGIFCEALAARIADDIRTATKAHHVSVSVTQKPRGGISIIATAERGARI